MPPKMIWVGEIRYVKKNEEEGKSMHDCDGIGCTQLHWAAMGGYLDACKYLVEKHKVDPNTTTILCTHVWGLGKGDASAMHMSANNGHFETFKYLHEQGGKIDAEDQHMCTPLLYACFKGRTDIVKYLLENGADPHKVDEKNRGCKENAMVGKQCAKADPLYDVDEEEFDDIVKILDEYDVQE